MTDRIGLTVRTANLDRAQPPRWAWRLWIVRGYLNLMLGNEGIGKGTLIAWLIARLTLGELPGDLEGQAVSVAVLGDEDGFDDVWVPRLHAQGADLTRVVQIERPDGGFVNVREDRERLTAVVQEHGIALLYFDQLLDNLGVGVDDWRQKPVRDALQPLRALARELDIATLGCLHPNKRADSFRQLFAGTPAFNSVSRSSLLLAQHPDDEHRRVLVRGKGNLAQAPAGVEFELSAHQFTANGFEFNVPLARDFTEGDLTVEDLIGDDNKRNEHSTIATAAEIIEALLPRDGNWHPAKPMFDACAAEEIGERTVKRAKARLHVEHRRTQTFPAAVEWSWPPTQDTTPDTHRSSGLTVPTVPTVPTTNGRKPLRSSSEDTQDTQDTENKRTSAVPTAKPTPNGQIDANAPAEREVEQRAIHYVCPECGAKVGKRCRTENRTPNTPGYPPSRRYVTVRKYSHGERVTLAWREWLAHAHGGAVMSEDTAEELRDTLISSKAPAVSEGRSHRSGDKPNGAAR